MLDLFGSEDPRERDYLKTTLHRIYGIFFSHSLIILFFVIQLCYVFVRQVLVFALVYPSADQVCLLELLLRDRDAQWRR